MDWISRRLSGSFPVASKKDDVDADAEKPTKSKEKEKMKEKVKEKEKEQEQDDEELKRPAIRSLTNNLHHLDTLLPGDEASSKPKSPKKSPKVEGGMIYIPHHHSKAKSKSMEVLEKEALEEKQQRAQAEILVAKPSRSPPEETEKIEVDSSPRSISAGHERGHQRSSSGPLSGHHGSSAEMLRDALEKSREELAQTQHEFDRRLHVLSSALQEKAEETVTLMLQNDKWKSSYTTLETNFKTMAGEKLLIESQFESEKALSASLVNKVTSLMQTIDEITKENTRLKAAEHSSPAKYSSSNGSGSPAVSLSDSPNRLARSNSSGPSLFSQGTGIVSSPSSSPSKPPAESITRGASFTLVETRKASLSISASNSPISKADPKVPPSEMEKQINRMKFELILSKEKERSLRESLDVYEEELRKSKREARVNLENEGRRREELERQVKRLETKIEELEFMMPTSSETSSSETTTFDASEFEDIEEELGDSSSDVSFGSDDERSTEKALDDGERVVNGATSARSTSSSEDKVPSSPRKESSPQLAHIVIDELDGLKKPESNKKAWPSSSPVKAAAPKLRLGKSHSPHSSPGSSPNSSKDNSPRDEAKKGRTMRSSFDGPNVPSNYHKRGRSYDSGERRAKPKSSSFESAVPLSPSTFSPSSSSPSSSPQRISPKSPDRQLGHNRHNSDEGASQLGPTPPVEEKGRTPQNSPTKVTKRNHLRTEDATILGDLTARLETAATLPAASSSSSSSTTSSSSSSPSATSSPPASANHLPSNGTDKIKS